MLLRPADYLLEQQEYITRNRPTGCLRVKVSAARLNLNDLGPSGDDRRQRRLSRAVGRPHFGEDRSVQGNPTQQTGVATFSSVISTPKSGPS
jgi:hypothetical protein